LQFAVIQINGIGEIVAHNSLIYYLSSLSFPRYCLQMITHSSIINGLVLRVLVRTYEQAKANKHACLWKGTSRRENMLYTNLMASIISSPICTQLSAWFGLEMGSPETQ